MSALESASPWSRWVMYPLRDRIAPALVVRQVAPWRITVVGGICALGAAGAFVTGSVAGQWIGAVLAQAAVLCDFLDGEVARRGGGGSAIGVVLDRFFDRVRSVLLATAIALGSGTAVAILGVGLYLGAILVEGTIPEAARELVRRRKAISGLDRFVLRIRDRMTRHGLRAVLVGFNEREAIAFGIAPLLALGASGLWLSVVVGAPFIVLRLLLDAAVAREHSAASVSAEASGTLVVVGAGTHQLALVRRAQERGLFVLAVDRDPEAAGARQANRCLCVSAHDPAAVLSTLEDALDGLPLLVGVMAGGARGCIETAALLAQAYGKIGIDPEAGRVLATKALLLERAREIGLVRRPVQLVADRAEAHALLEQIGPVVIKPPDSSGGRGIGLASTGEALEDAWNRARSVAPAGPLLVEGFVEGRDLGVVLLGTSGSVQVWLIFEKLADEGGFGSPGVYRAEASLEEDERRRVEDFARSAVEKLGIDRGPSYVEVRLAACGALELIEAEVCIPGTFIGSELVPRVCGASFLDACIDGAIGRDPAVPSTSVPRRRSRDVRLYLRRELAPASARPLQYASATAWIEELA